MENSARKKSSRGVSVLLVEDDRSLRRFIEIVLERSGFDVVSAADGGEGMKLVTTGNFDVVITDAMMPNLNGYEFCRLLKSDPRLSHLPVILLSALEPVGAQRNEPIDAFLTKPVSPEELVECVEGVLLAFKLVRR